MWKNYKEFGNNVSYETYRAVFEDERISFGQPSQDECDKCSVYNTHVKEKGEFHDEVNCDICSCARVHLAKAEVARHEYQKTINGD